MTPVCPAAPGTASRARDLHLTDGFNIVIRSAQEIAMTALPPRQKVIPCLWFDKQAEEAVGFYVSLLPDSRIDAVIRSPGRRR